MTCYSHSRLSTFENCKYKYKLQYIDKIKVDVPTTVEAFMGDLVHQTLEKLYTDLKFQKLNTLKELLKFYHELWEKEWTDEILIVKKEYSADNYKKMGEKYITDYYKHYEPFEDMTILGLETEERMTLPDGYKYHVRIDKLGFKGNTYFVCDYKTNSRLKDQEEADSDRQLGMYSIWVKDKFKDAKKVILKWHMLAFDKEITSERTDDELKKLQKETLTLIKKIELCKDYPVNVNKLCDYCVYKNMCPSFKHEAELEEKTAVQFKKDDGVKFVDELEKFDAHKKHAEEKIEEIKEKIIEFAKQKGIDIVIGSNRKASVKPDEKFEYPKTEEFIELLKKKGLYDELVTINYQRFKSSILKRNIDAEILKQIKTEQGWTVRLVGKRDKDE
ncbi:MAG: PD-(D/E)XK nuclease family protein [Candidatus Woesearchaeota archaeon]|jgi:putative RecB family exonuclease